MNHKLISTILYRANKWHLSQNLSKNIYGIHGQEHPDRNFSLSVRWSLVIHKLWTLSDDPSASYFRTEIPDSVNLDWFSHHMSQVSVPYNEGYLVRKRMRSIKWFKKSEEANRAILSARSSEIIFLSCGKNEFLWKMSAINPISGTVKVVQ